MYSMYIQTNPHAHTHAHTHTTHHVQKNERNTSAKREEQEHESNDNHVVIGVRASLQGENDDTSHTYTYLAIQCLQVCLRGVEVMHEIDKSAIAVFV